MQQAQASCDKKCHQQIQAIIDHDRDLYSIPAVQVSIIYPDKNIPDDFVSGTTKTDNHVPLQKDNLFQVGSETKSFVGTIMLQLEAERQLSLDDKISKWLPGLPYTWNKITIRQLLNHTSGIYDYFDVLIDMAEKKQLDLLKQWSAAELIDLVVKKPNYFEPGKGWHYSNSNYVLAGMIIEAVTHTPFSDIIHDRLIRPLGLTNTYYASAKYDSIIMSRMAHGYSKIAPFPITDIATKNSSWANSAGANISTAHDMAIWFKTLLTGKLLPTAQFHEMMSLVDEANGQSIPDTRRTAGYGLGIMHDFTTFGEETWLHSGGTLGYSSFMIWLKSRNIIIAVNGSDISSLIPEKRDLFYLTQDIVSFLQK